MTKVTLSIVVPVYNSGKYLSESLDSILTYNGKNTYEIVIVDDGSTDELTLSLLNKYKEKYENIQLITQINQGPTAARNKGCSMAQGDIIFFFDSDNILYPNKCFDKAVAIFTDRPDISVVYGERVFFKDGSDDEQRYYQGPFTIEELCDHSMIDMCAFIRKDVWTKNGGFDTRFRFCEDWDFWLTSYENGFKFLQIPEVWFKYRIDVPNSVGTLCKDEDVERQTMSDLFAKHYDLFYKNYRASFKKNNRFNVVDKVKMKYRRLLNR